MCALNSINSGLANPFERVDIHDHICMVYQTQDEQLNVLVPFIKAGLEHGEKCLVLGTEPMTTELCATMNTEGIDTDKMMKSGDLITGGAPDVSSRKNSLPIKKMLVYLREMVETAKASGFPCIRVACDMSWMLGTSCSIERMVEYETGIARFVADYEAGIVCQYRINHFGPQLALDAINIHPHVIANGLICRNYYAIAPEDFIRLNRPYLEVKRSLDSILRDNMIAVARRDTPEQRRGKAQA